MIDDLRAPGSPLRVAVVGAESTGKSTLARAITEEHAAVISEEFARHYAEKIGRPLGPRDAPVIALGQRDVMRNAVQHAVAKRARYVVFDTDLTSTYVYSRHYYGSRIADPVLTMAKEWRSDLYLFCQPDLPFVVDAVRDGAADRDVLTRAFADTLAALGANVVEIRGDGVARREAARRALDGTFGPDR